ncbi:MULTISPECIES: hypothetical protein [unclassified Prochlorococcus]|uniref:hypothetical protein n=1 Tax=unclassified Prochlorococcus TaxID=2627481 RepID=UPI000533766E|nr:MULTISPECIES: hypothetical protein [unclassified Prochlorococcus]KGG14964.1 putative Peptidase family M20/M25/M40 [Prochlorococcus sp. MIT 0602]KGG15600.1 putative Peptidase family M20/M25/M40 [Prochlorococcus sp. MIT 0603]
MGKRSPIAIFLAASALLATSTINPSVSNAGKEPMGGLKEWTSDQEVDEKSTLDKEAKKLRKKAKEEDICIPIGEGENCW